MSNVPISNPPSDLTMNDVKAMSSAFGGLAKSSRYYIRIIPQGSLLVSLGYNSFVSQLSYLSESVEMPGRGFNNIDVRYHGPNFKLPFQSVYEDVTMTFLCRTQSFERQFFDDWMEIINPTNLWDFNYKDQYRAEIQVYQMATFGENENSTAPIATYQWTIHEAYPTVINPQAVTWADDNFQRLTITFTYTKWTRRGRDKDPAGFRDRFVQGAVVEGLPTRVV